MATIKDLFSAYRDSELPMDGGYILSSFFDQNTSYTRYEVIAYNNVKDIYITDEGIVFNVNHTEIIHLRIVIPPFNSILDTITTRWS